MAKTKSKEETKESGSENKKLQETIDDIKQRFGEGAIMKLREVRAVDVEAIPTGSIALDLALGVGGIPRGRIVEIFGAESTGKSTLALHILAQAQKRKGIGAFVDAEHALDPDYAKKIGVDIEELLISQPESGEQALQIVETLVRSGTVDVIVVDSVAALTPKAEIVGEMGDSHLGLQARLLSQACRKLRGIISDARASVVFLNQIRMKIAAYGDPETTSGGLALKFYSSVRIRLKRVAQIKYKDEIIGSRIRAQVVKNKVAAPFRTAEFDIYYNEGISRTADILKSGLDFGVVKRMGSWFQYGQQKLGQGVEGAKQFLKENPKLQEEIEKEISKAAYDKEHETQNT